MIADAGGTMNLSGHAIRRDAPFQHRKKRQLLSQQQDLATRVMQI